MRQHSDHGRTRCLERWHPRMRSVGSMIISVEGPSAAGKTTWCRSRFPGRYVPETLAKAAGPQPADHTQLARLWTEANCARLQQALDLERESGLAVCDGDPFKLHYTWCMWQ